MLGTVAEILLGPLLVAKLDDKAGKPATLKSFKEVAEAELPCASEVGEAVELPVRYPSEEVRPGLPSWKLAVGLLLLQDLDSRAREAIEELEPSDRNRCGLNKAKVQMQCTTAVLACAYHAIRRGLPEPGSSSDDLMPERLHMHGCAAPCGVATSRAAREAIEELEPSDRNRCGLNKAKVQMQCTTAVLACAYHAIRRGLPEPGSSSDDLMPERLHMHGCAAPCGVATSRQASMAQSPWRTGLSAVDAVLIPGATAVTQPGQKLHAARLSGLRQQGKALLQAHKLLLQQPGHHWQVPQRVQVARDCGCLGHILIPRVAAPPQPALGSRHDEGTSRINREPATPQQSVTRQQPVHQAHVAATGRGQSRCCSHRHTSRRPAAAAAANTSPVLQAATGRREREQQAAADEGKG
ncbi:hypothetical protein TSOC_009385 [Tetrabaena socialis]|uniref:Uncharacterized protein n=1 Tax=Tetrabaena socialis TaxID=47790 RepID=A0A2J7ZW05_9CHLO|nr:hypothetical protein TSOC_009385 [Tetrabaena socialis]|eukprot:PNH04453.1 hypothetical protein TSOC_009385 [Tetrabaena socialis]